MSLVMLHLLHVCVCVTGRTSMSSTSSNQTVIGCHANPMLFLRMLAKSTWCLPHMWAAGRESDKKSEETENILMERNDKLSQSRMRHETRQGPELILTVSHQIRPRLSYVSEALADQEVVMSTLRLLIFTELSADWACSEKAGRDFSHNE